MGGLGPGPTHVGAARLCPFGPGPSAGRCCVDPAADPGVTPACRCGLVAVLALPAECILGDFLAVVSRRGRLRSGAAGTVMLCCP